MTEARRVALVVDDSEVFRYFASTTLAEAGFEVVTASTLADALDLARETRPDVVYLDWHLDGTTSEDLCRRLRRDLRLHACRIIVVSASAAEDLRERCDRAGADGFVEKRAEGDALIAVLQGVRGDRPPPD